MIEPIAWMQRQFTFDQPIGVFPALVERVGGTPVRAGALVAGVPEELLGTRVDGKWSVKEHLGHLGDLGALDEKRLDDFRSRASVLSPADMRNRATEEGNHRATPIAEILENLRAGRDRLVQELESLTAEEVSVTAIHPRLQQPMRLLDWLLFVAEHDDHHLASARRVIRQLSRG